MYINKFLIFHNTFKNFFSVLLEGKRLEKEEAMWDKYHETPTLTDIGVASKPMDLDGCEKSFEFTGNELALELKFNEWLAWNLCRIWVAAAAGASTKPLHGS